MKILIVSDTHKKNENYFKVLEMHHPDMVIHCGDAEGSEYALSAAAKLRSEQTVTPLHEQSPATYFLRLNNLETFVELVGARPLHLLSQTVLPLKIPTGAFIAALRKRGLCVLSAAVEGDKRPGKAPFAGVVFCLIRQPRQKASRLVLWGWHQPPLWRCFIFSCTPSFF